MMMNNNILKIGFWMGVMALFTTSCSEDKVATYSGPDAINLQINKKDSADVSFLAIDPELSEYVFNVEVQIQSEASDRDREVKFVLGDSTTAVVGENFEFTDKVIVPAGEVLVILPVKVYKKGLIDVDGGLVVEIVVANSEDFVPGVYGRMKLTFVGDYPKTWQSSSGDLGYIPSFLGKCTKAKYEFVFNHLGTIDLVKYVKWEFGPIMALQAELNRKLDEYAADNQGKRLPDDDGSDMLFSANT